ncbi:zinc finger protein 567-like [Sphaerodactylus townsendi]|uniref:Uncharacterized protein n=1 Tax=Sphaerodactylus townsendi TaxID=933632 RepID=A0ACB8EGE6_9SAUR|nr:zinc finger protein 567-like [Sphaerodactylus townsendi]
MAAEENLQDPETFEEVSVSVIEEKEFPLDPSLLALSGNDVQQYCTMLSLMEFQNIKPGMFLKTEQGQMPLSLVTVTEEYEVAPCSYEGNWSVPFDLPQQGSPGPQVRIHYDFLCHSKGDTLQGNPFSCSSFSKSEQETDLQTSKDESVASGENLSTFSEIQKVRLLEQGLMGNSNKASPQGKGSRQPNEMDFTEGQGSVDLASKQNNAPNSSRFNLLPGNGLRTAGHCRDRGVGEVSIHQTTQPGERNRSCSNSRERVSEQPSSVVPERSHSGETRCSCPSCGGVFSLNGNAVTHQLSHTGEKLYKCPSCGHLFACNTPGGAERPPVTPTHDWERLFSKLDLKDHSRPNKNGVKKPFHCPDCGLGFVHKSSIPRHQKLHRKENLSQNPGQEKSCSPTENKLCSPTAQSGKTPLSCPGSRSPSAGKGKASFSALCEVCGQGFSLACKFQRHLAAHWAEKPFRCCHCGKAFRLKSVLTRHLLLHQPEKPFRCLCCEKSYIQKCHLNRHFQQHHGASE